MRGCCARRSRNAAIDDKLYSLDVSCFRTLAVAAMIVLALAPEALVHPSFRSLGA